MRIELDIRKTVEENAAVYFEKAKKAKKKHEGAKKALLLGQKKQKAKKAEEQTPQKVKKREWYEKFRWFVSSEGFLVLGGRDATTNEILIKKHTQKNDLVLHAELAGSPFVVIKTQNKKPGSATINEAGEFCASFSRAWKEGYSSAQVYHVKPEQVSKKAKHGEYLAKGSFMIYGKRTYLEPSINVGVGVYNGKVMAGPVSAIKKHCEHYVEIMQGNQKASDVAKKIQKILQADLDEIIRALPPGSLAIKNIKNI
jgi:predicted ribosome quality control (RQC) complex YloA/Tae2 family protein